MFKSFDMSQLKTSEIYHLMISTIIPRPIAWVSTLSPNGIANLAPFSYFNAVSSNPPTLMFSVGKKSDGSKKDTLKNIELTQQFVVNMTSKALLNPMHGSSAEYDYEESEWEKGSIKAEPSFFVKPCRVAGSPVTFECETYKIIELFDDARKEVSPSTMVIGKILWTHVLTSIIDKDPQNRLKIDPVKMDPMARLGGNSYSTLNKIIDLPKAHKIKLS